MTADDHDDEPWSPGCDDWFRQEPDGTIRRCEPVCDGVWHPCVACQGTGWARNQVIR